MQAQRCVSTFRDGQPGDLAAPTISHLAIFVAERADWLDHASTSAAIWGMSAEIVARPVTVANQQ